MRGKTRVVLMTVKEAIIRLRKKENKKNNLRHRPSNGLTETNLGTSLRRKRYVWDHCLAVGWHAVQWIGRHLIEVEQIRYFCTLQNSFCCCSQQLHLSMKASEPATVPAIQAQATTPPEPCFTDEGDECFLYTLLLLSLWYKSIFVSSVHKTLFQNSAALFGTS